MKDKIALGVALVAVVIAIYALGSNVMGSPAFGGAACNGGNCTDYDAVNTSAGYYVDDTQIIDGSGNFVNFISSVLATFNAGILHSYVNSTSTTATAYTLVPDDIVDYESVIITPNKGDLTLTFPASSTLSEFVPTAGDWAEQCWYNASTTAGIDLTFAAGTGIDLEVASSTTGAAGSIALTILADNSGCFKYIRKPATASAFDILVQFTRFVNGD